MKSKSQENELKCISIIVLEIADGIFESKFDNFRMKRSNQGIG